MLKKNILDKKFYLIDLFFNYRIISLLIIGFILSSSLAFSQNQVAKKSPSGTWYYEYLPADYDENTDDYPIMFFFHGLGERGNNEGDLTKVARNGPPKHVKQGHDFPFIIISPQLKTHLGNWPPNYMDEVVEHALNKGLRIDENRIYITGLSLGGGGAWYYAQSFPEKIAAVAPVCGSRNSTNKAEDIAAENVPIWAFHGDSDGVVSVNRTLNMIEAIENCTPAINPEPKMTIYEGVGHNAWSRAYRTDNSLHSPNIYEWFMQQSKSSVSVDADAGEDKTINLPTNSTTLSGSANSPAAINDYLWEKVSGPTVTLSNTSTATLSVSNAVAGIYKFRLTATDADGNSASDQVQLTVVSSNSPPVANAGSDKQVQLPTNSISISGSGTDSDGNIISYSWQKTSGGEATITNAGQANPSLSNLEAGVYIFELTVEDDDNATGSDELRLEVLDEENLSPEANAGGDITVQLPNNSTNLAGSGSDGDGTIVSYLWEKTSGPSTTISNGDNSTATANNLVSGSYTFRLTVTDDDGATDSDLKQVTVVEENQVPTVSISNQEQDITLPTSTTNIQATASDPDGNIASYLWEIVSEAGASTLQNSNTATLTVNDLNVAGQYVYSIKVTDNEGVTNSDTAIVNIIEEDFNERPFVDAGRDQFIVLPENEVVLEGYASDPDGEIVSYVWEKVSTMRANLTGENTATLTASNLVEGIYHFRLTATDNDGAHKTHATYVDVKAEEYNILPTVDAGTNKAIGSYKNFTTFNATASDMDGEIVSYRWELISGENDFVWSGINTPTIELSELKIGIYKFQVTVEDDRGGLATDEVRLKVRDSNISFTKDGNYSDNPTIFELAQLSLVSDSILIENVPENASIRWFYEDALQEQYNEKSKIPFNLSGSYFVVVESNDYSVTSDVYEFTITSNQSKIDYQSVRIYPNPTSNYYLNIQSGAFNSEEIVLQLHNLNGKVVHSENVNNNQLKIGYRMELPNQLNNGMYQLKIVDGGKLGIFKIILR